MNLVIAFLLLLVKNWISTNVFWFWRIKFTTWQHDSKKERCANKRLFFVTAKLGRKFMIEYLPSEIIEKHSWRVLEIQNKIVRTMFVVRRRESVNAIIAIEACFFYIRHLNFVYTVNKAKVIQTRDEFFWNC